MSIYLKLTDGFNRKGLRAVICSGQAVVLHRLAVMSKDGDWIVREDNESLDHILTVLADFGATYRFGAPLDSQWLEGGWSSHFEFRYEGMRVRTDFFSRPPRLSETDLRKLWDDQEGQSPPFTNVRDLVRIKMTQREKDYPVIGELARLLTDPADQLLYSRSAFELIEYCRQDPALAERLAAVRPLIFEAMGRDADHDIVAEALDAERRLMIKADAARIAGYERTAAEWRKVWPQVRNRIEGLPLLQSHLIVQKEAERWLPKIPTK